MIMVKVGGKRRSVRERAADDRPYGEQEVMWD